MLYRAWSRDVPRKAKDDKSYIISGEEQDDYQDDNRTDDADDSNYGPKSLHTNYGRKGYWSTETPNVVRRNPARLVRNILLSEVNLNNSKLPSLSKGILFSHNQQIGGRSLDS